jgi:hypothetical protein
MAEKSDGSHWIVSWLASLRREIWRESGQTADVVQLTWPATPDFEIITQYCFHFIAKILHSFVFIIYSFYLELNR